MSQQKRDDEGRRPGPVIPPFRGPGGSRPALRPSGRGAPRVAVTRVVLPPPKLTPVQNVAVSAPPPVEPPRLAAPPAAAASLVRPATAPAVRPADEELSAIASLAAGEQPSAAADLPLLGEFIEQPAPETPHRHATPTSAAPATRPSPVGAETVPAIGGTALHVAEALEQVAQRLRRGELALGPHVVPSEEAALALAMTALLGARG